MSPKLPPTKESGGGSVPNETVPLQCPGTGLLLASGQIDEPSTLRSLVGLGLCCDVFGLRLKLRPSFKSA